MSIKDIFSGPKAAAEKFAKELAAVYAEIDKLEAERFSLQHASLSAGEMDAALSRVLDENDRLARDWIGNHAHIEAPEDFALPNLEMDALQDFRLEVRHDLRLLRFVCRDLIQRAFKAELSTLLPKSAPTAETKRRRLAELDKEILDKYTALEDGIESSGFDIERRESTPPEAIFRNLTPAAAAEKFKSLEAMRAKHLKALHDAQAKINDEGKIAQDLRMRFTNESRITERKELEKEIEAKKASIRELARQRQPIDEKVKSTGNLLNNCNRYLAEKGIRVD